MIKRIREYTVLSSISDHEDLVSNSYVVKKDKYDLMRVARLYAIDDMSEVDVHRVLYEIRVLASINHPNIMEYYDAFVDEKIGFLVIISEYCEQGTLRAVLEKRKAKQGEGSSPFLQEEIEGILVQVVMGLREIKRFNIIHRNVKPANVFINDDGIVKLGDFSFAKFEVVNQLNTQIGTPQYASPEVFRAMPYTYKSDIWSIGVLLFELMFARLPFQAEDFEELMELVLARDFKMGESVKRFPHVALISDRCMQINPDDRPDLGDLLRHKYLTNALREMFTAYPELMNIEKENLSKKLLSEVKYDHESRDYGRLNKVLINLRLERIAKVLGGVDDLNEPPQRRTAVDPDNDTNRRIKFNTMNTKELENHMKYKLNSYGMIYYDEIKRFGNSRHFTAQKAKVEAQKEIEEIGSTLMRDVLPALAKNRVERDYLSLKRTKQHYPLLIQKRKWHYPSIE